MNACRAALAAVALLASSCGIANAISGDDLNSDTSCSAGIGDSGCVCTGADCACIDGFNCRCSGNGCTVAVDDDSNTSCTGPGCACDDTQCVCEGATGCTCVGACGTP